MTSRTIFRTGLAAAAALTTAVFATTAAHAVDQEGTSDRNPGMQRMHELHMQGNPGMQRMHDKHMGSMAA